MKFAELLAHWRGILASIAAVLMVVLQVIQLLLSSEIGMEVAQKTEAIIAKTDTLDTLVDKNAAAITVNNTLIEKNSMRHEQILQQIAALEAELREVDEGVKDISKDINGKK